MRQKDLARERICFDVLRSVEGKEVVLIGGYAVSAYGPPRFSVDLDLVLKRSALVTVRDELLSRGFRKDAEWRGGDVFEGRSERWILGSGQLPISADILIGGISDRVSGAAHSYESLRKRSSPRTLRGLNPLSVARPLVPDREVLIALKLEVGRLIDLRDIAILAGERVDGGNVISFLSGASENLILEHARALLASIERKEFKDSLKGVYMLDDRAYQRYAAGARNLALWIERRLTHPGGNNGT